MCVCVLRGGGGGGEKELGLLQLPFSLKLSSAEH